MPKWNRYNRKDHVIQYALMTPRAWIQGQPDFNSRWWSGDHNGASHCILMRDDGKLMAVTCDEARQYGWETAMMYDFGKNPVIVKHMYVRMVI